MKTIQIKTFAALAVVTLLSLAPAANAGTIYTAPLSFQQLFGQTMRCKITNVAQTPTKVQTRLIYQNGDVSDDSGVIQLAPFESAELGPANGAGRYYCRFDIKGSKRRVRANACTTATNATRCLALLPAE